MLSDDLIVIVPALNAEKTLSKVISDVRAVYKNVTVVVINDGSSDQTGKIAGRLGAAVIENPRNLGLGASIKKGVEYGLNSGKKIFVTIGADDQRDTQDIPRMLDVLGGEGYDIVFGSKFLLMGQKMPLIRKFGNILVSYLFNLLFNTNFTDVTSGFRVFNRKVAAAIPGLPDRYAFDVALCARTVKYGLSYKEVPVKVFYRKGISKMRCVFIIGLGMIFVMLKERFFDKSRKNIL